jgi:hypothetical protein
MNNNNIINKLGELKDNHNWYNCNWSSIEKKQLLELYLIICKKENHIFDLVYNNHGCDSYEDIFRDYDCNYLFNKTQGVKEALDYIDYCEEEDKTEDEEQNV